MDQLLYVYPFKVLAASSRIWECKKHLRGGKNVVRIKESKKCVKLPTSVALSTGNNCQTDG